MSGELIDARPSIQVRRHRWGGGALHPSEEVWDVDAALPDRTDDNSVRETKCAVWAIPPQLTIGLDAGAQAGSGRRRISWALRNQNFQPTCVAQAAVACVELLQVTSALPDDGTPVLRRFSVRFLYQRMRETEDEASDASQRPPDWQRGFTRLSSAADVLRSEGICLEELWPDNDQILDKPPAKVLAAAKKFVFTPMHYVFSPKQLDRQRGIARLILSDLTAGLPVAIALPAFSERGARQMPNNWTRAAVLLTGNVADPLAGDKPVKGSGHAICIVGFLPDEEEPLGGFFVFRNSLGEDFAMLPPPSVLGRGYGTISASHVEAHCWELLTLKNAVQ